MQFRYLTAALNMLILEQLLWFDSHGINKVARLVIKRLFKPHITYLLIMQKSIAQFDSVLLTTSNFIFVENSELQQKF